MVREWTISFIMRVECDLTRTQENSMILGILLSAKFNYVVLTTISKTVLSKNKTMNMNICVVSKINKNDYLAFFNGRFFQQHRFIRINAKFEQ